MSEANTTTTPRPWPDERVSDIRNYQPQTIFAKRRRRLGLTVKQAARYLRISYDTARKWNTGATEAPRPALRLLAVYRLHRWRKY